ncbi:hypothetical protein QTP81_00150 [Alteromonas sp. ASW11-36]|uniref:CPXCG motif-containing cysteine-rich protein n=1 Tax=Alteromonas arenosi TaxID=3055817 RepID=A0ABT7SS77_9ALTE|nr:hypothetical protein [Alteromonas sp. ASW11-36]MDM7859011.1 hypothetical protein [Alteromonas sp. ASW11-36]
MQMKHDPRPAEYLCPDCGHINIVSSHLLRDKYCEHETHCARCNHLLEIVVTDGLGDSMNIIASSLNYEDPAA